MASPPLTVILLIVHARLLVNEPEFTTKLGSTVVLLPFNSIAAPATVIVFALTTSPSSDNVPLPDISALFSTVKIPSTVTLSQSSALPSSVKSVYVPLSTFDPAP